MSQTELKSATHNFQPVVTVLADLVQSPTARATTARKCEQQVDDNENSTGAGDHAPETCLKETPRRFHHKMAQRNHTARKTASRLFALTATKLLDHDDDKLVRADAAAVSQHFPMLIFKTS